MQTKAFQAWIWSFAARPRWPHREIVAILALPDVQQKILSVGLELATNTPEQFTQSYNAAIATWTKLATDAKLKFE